MKRYSIQARTRKYVNGYEFLTSARNLSNKHGKLALDIDTKTGLDLIKSAPKIVVRKPAKTTGEFIGNKSFIGNKINDPNVSKFRTRKWIKVNELLGGQYSANKIIRFKTPMITFIWL